MDTTAVIYAFLSAVLMATIGVFSKLTGLPAEIITFFRLMFGAGFMLLFLTIAGKARMIRQWPSYPVFFTGILLSGFIIFYVQAMNHTSMANAIILVYLAPLAASVAAHCFLDERLTIPALALILLALFGTIAYVEPVAVVLFGWTLFQEMLGPLQIAGCLLIISSGVLKTVAK